MTPRLPRLPRFALAAAIVAIAATPLVPFAARAAGYTAQPLAAEGGTLRPTGLSPDGVVVGDVHRADGTDSGVSVQVGQAAVPLCPAQASTCQATGINAAHRVTGIYTIYTPHQDLGFTVDADGSHYVELPVPPYGYTWPLAINDRGATTGMHEVNLRGTHAYIGSPNLQHARDLGTLQPPGFGESYGLAINRRGQLVGGSDIGGGHHAIFYDPAEPDAGLRDLGTPHGARDSEASAISDDGWIVGWSSLPGTPHTQHAFAMHGPHAMTDLGTLPGDVHSYAHAVGRGGIVVGTSIGDGTAVRAFIVDMSTRVMRDLNAETVGLPAGVTLYEANAINAIGQIAASGTDGRAYLLTPL